MKKTLYSKYDKKAISDLPIEIFDGRIEVVLTEAEAEKAVDFLLSADILGMDTETRPSFKRGLMYHVALLQVSTRDVCFLFRLNLIGLCPAVIRLLENTSVPMIGLSWHDDLRMLHKRGDFVPGTFIELQSLVGDLGVKDLSLQKLYANLFGRKISKRQRLTNWEAPILNDGQKVYAATDAWACIKLYEEIERLKATREFDLIVVPEPEPVVTEKAEQKAEVAPSESVKKTKRKPAAKVKATPKAKKKVKTNKKDSNGIQEGLPEER